MDYQATSNLLPLLQKGTLETLLMVGIAAPGCAISGLFLGLLLTATQPQGVAPSRVFYQALSAFTNISRSVPFLILIVLLLPVTRLLVGTSIGTWAAIVPLVLGGMPYAARLAEAALLEVEPGLIQAVVVMGASAPEILLKVYLPEALSGLLRAFTVLSITMINFSAMAGAVGGGGLGDLAIRYGYQRFRIDVLAGTVLILIVLVQVIQFGGNYFAKRFYRR
ncbi:ABC transporter permease subunit [Granulicella sp. dw_53]|uniref:methionine ABC transporter permease n=1 Tax=Granulicella sp. dw_53 TaxID=2719792 RepID=UPI001BD2ED6C|nr:ABC transporter permease subunit [Granulicella sp. dw_53]